ncbi:hypothetical protein DFP73DRAFT_523005 [Morchella snyderi]|nr:hypothetical protein DFP73DRAFT_523005 [Morchella snyderi]
MSDKIFILKSKDGKPLKLDTAIDVEPYISSLKGNTTVEEIRLGGNTLGIDACRALGEILKSNKNLKVFKADDIFTGRLISEIPDALTALLTPLLDLPHLHTVDLSDNAFGGRLAEPLRDFYSKAGPLRHLLLNNNGLGPAGGTIVANAIRDLASLKSTNSSFPPLETIVCGRNRLENGSMDAWAAAYAAHKTLKTVKMVQNGIRQEGIDKLLRDGLSKCAGLETVDLQDNTFTSYGATALATVVTGWSDMVELAVGDCLLGARGGVILAEALGQGKNKAIQTLRLQFNEIDAKGIEALERTVKQSLPSLRLMELNGNKFSEDDTAISALREIFEDRGFGELDELDELEEESDEDEDEDEDEEEDDEKEDIVKDAEDEEQKKVPQRKDAVVDELADILGGTKI